MNPEELSNRYKEIAPSVFSDETELFRTPSEPDPEDAVSIRLRAAKGSVNRVLLMISGQSIAFIMKKIKTDGYFDWFESQIVCTSQPVSYCFIADFDGGRLLYDKTGAHLLSEEDGHSPELPFRFTPGFHVPQWAKGAVQYQIMTDRFCCGNTDNNVADNEYYYEIGHSKHVEDWNACPTEKDIRCFYGGDLSGIIMKLDYLQNLGIEAIYLNPIFISPSSHKYDTQDYDHIDPHFGVITDDLDYQMQNWEMHNGYAQRYIRRVTSEENLKKSDDLFALLCSELHSRGMKIILDGVFNHCGSFNKWMDREGIYLGKPGYEEGAAQSPDSPYRKYFSFNTPRGGRGPEYEGWWGYVTLPKLNYENSPELCEKIYSIAEKWASPPYCIDGWRLDVAADLGHSEEFNHKFWKEFRRRLKKINPDLLIVAEHYGNPAAWLKGDEWDSVMNYDAFMEPVTFFLTGMEKHSDSRRDDLYLNGSAFFRGMLSAMACFERPSLMSAMNELSNHDHSRFMTRTNGRIGRTETVGPAAAGEGIRPAVFRMGVVMQMTLPGAPTIYYGDEAGQVGWTDPDCRRTYPWGNEDEELIDLHRSLISLRKDYPVLRSGSFLPLAEGTGVIAYARFDGEQTVLVVCNASESSLVLPVRVRNAGVADGKAFRKIFETNAGGHAVNPEGKTAVLNGEISVEMPACSSAILVMGDAL